MFQYQELFLSVLDTETTGLSVKDGHRIVEIGCIELDNLVPTKNIFHFYLNPERKVSEKAFEVHGYSDEFLATKQKFADIADDFIDFIKDKKIIIHNAEFDIGHLNNELTLIGKPKISTANVIDTLELARNKFPGMSNSLDALCKRFNIDLSRRTKHNALLDCELLREVYINLLHKASRLILEPGNLFLANSNVSIIFTVIIFFFPTKDNSLFK